MLITWLKMDLKFSSVDKESYQCASAVMDTVGALLVFIPALTVPYPRSMMRIGLSMMYSKEGVLIRGLL